MTGTAIELRDVFRVHSTPEGDAAALQGLTLRVADWVRSATTASPSMDGNRWTTPTTRAAICSPSTSSGMIPRGPAAAAIFGVTTTGSAWPSVGCNGR